MGPSAQQQDQQERVKTAEEIAQEEKLAASLDQAAQPRQRTGNAELLALIVENDQKAEYARQVVEAELVRDAFDQDWRLAKVFAMSGVFGDIKGVTQNQAIATAMAKIQLGRSWGLSPGDAMQFVYFTNGRPAVMVEILGVKMREAGFDWDIDFIYERPGDDTSKCTGCRLWLKKRNAAGVFESVKDRHSNDVSAAFTKADADAAMIWEKGKQIPLSSKWNFQSWAADMYFARALGRLRKRHASNVLSGAITVQEAEEIQPKAPEPPAEPEPKRRSEAAPKQDRPSEPKPAEPATGSTGERKAAPEAAGAPAGGKDAPKTTSVPPAATGAQQKASDKPPADLKDLADWPDQSDAKWLKINGVVYRINEETGNYRAWVPEPGK